MVVSCDTPSLAGDLAMAYHGPVSHLALLEAIAHGRFRQAQLLVEGGADVNGKDVRGEPPLIAACRRVRDPRHRTRFVRLLLEHGADANGRDTLGCTALMHSAMLGLPDVALVLLDYEMTNQTLQDSLGNTALMYAASNGHEDIVKLLLTCSTRGSHIQLLRQTNKSGMTAIEQARRAGHKRTVAILKAVDGTPSPPKAPYNSPMPTADAGKRDESIPQDGQEDQEAQNDDETTTHHHQNTGGVTLLPREVRAILQQEGDVHPDSRPPTPLLPSLQLGRTHIDLNASQSSTRSEPANLQRPQRVGKHRHGHGHVAAMGSSSLLPSPTIQRSKSEPRGLSRLGDYSDNDSNSEDEFEEVLDLEEERQPRPKGASGLHLPPIRPVGLAIQGATFFRHGARRKDGKAVKRKSLEVQHQQQQQASSQQLHHYLQQSLPPQYGSSWHPSLPPD